MSDVRVTDIEVAKAIIAHERVDCLLATEHDVSDQPTEPVSCVGGTFWGAPGERWPVDESGESLMPWMQVVSSELDSPWGAFYRSKLVCFYLRQEFLDFDALAGEDRCDFVVREYESLDELVPLDRPASLGDHPFRRMTWSRVPDYPSLSKYYKLFDQAVYQAISDLGQNDAFEYEHRYGTKIGGWPTAIQSDQPYPGHYDMQIDMTENYMYGDCGTGMIDWGDLWYVLFECC